MPGNDLPDILPPFDIKAALSRINNNSQLLRKLLTMFVDIYGATVPTLRRHFAEGKYDDAVRLVHSLKGTAGILEAAELVAAASVIEHALKAGRTADAESHINDLERALAPALSAAESLDSPKQFPPTGG